MTLIVDPGQWDVALIMSLGQMVVLANLEDGPERLFWNGNLLPCAKSYRTRPQMTAMGKLLRGGRPWASRQHWAEEGKWNFAAHVLNDLNGPPAAQHPRQPVFAQSIRLICSHPQVS